MDIGQLRTEVESRISRLSTATYYELLGVPTDADAGAVKSAYVKWAQLLHADRYHSVDLGDLVPKMQRLLGEFSRIQSELSNPEKRKNYDAKLRLQSDGISTDVAQIFEAERLFNVGTRLVSAGRWTEALEKFETALATNPKESQYLAYKAFCEFGLLETDKSGAPKSAAAALSISKRLSAIVSESPKCECAYLFLGHIARATGDSVQAKKYYKATLRLNERNNEALSALRLVNMREEKKKSSFFGRLFGK